MTDTPQVFHWVSARAECSLYKVMKELQAGMKEDVEERNALRKGEAVKFSIGAESNRGFSVFREDEPMSGTSVDIAIVGDELAFTGETDFSAKITLNNEGRCILLVDGEELEQWQVRRKALEGLFFDSKRSSAQK